MKITHDFHVHTNLSLCARKETTLEVCAEQAKKLGLKKMAITNHVWDHLVPDWDAESAGDFYTIQDIPHISVIKEDIRKLNNGITEFLFGCETEYSFKHRRPAITPAVAEQMEVLLVPNSHTHITMPKSYYEPHEKHIQYMIDAFMDIVNSDVARYITAIPHPFLAVGCPYDNHELIGHIPEDEFKRCFTAAAEKDIALELNPNFINNMSLEEVYKDPLFRMYEIGKACGCKFTVGSDAHSEGTFANFANIYTMISLLDLKEEDICPLAR